MVSIPLLLHPPPQWSVLTNDGKKQQDRGVKNLETPKPSSLAVCPWVVTNPLWCLGFSSQWGRCACARGWDSGILHKTGAVSTAVQNPSPAPDTHRDQRLGPPPPRTLGWPTGHHRETFRTAVSRWEWPGTQQLWGRVLVDRWPGTRPL